MMSRWILLIAVFTALSSAAPVSAESFDGNRAMHWLEWQCDLGPRAPGTEGIAAFQASLETFADSLGHRFAREEFTYTSPLDGRDFEGANLVLSCGPEGGTRLWFGAHYDTRAVCDQDPDPKRRDSLLLGANDGASGVAVLMHLAELLAVSPPALGVDLIFFDAEDQGRASEAQTFCLGSQEMARRWKSGRGPLKEGNPMGLIVLDMVADHDLVLDMEATSLHYAGTWTRLIFQRAMDLGLGAFRAEVGRSIYDDHVPFLEAGVPAVDIIDFDFSPWHTTGDVPSSCSPLSLEQVGVLMLDLVRNPLQ